MLAIECHRLMVGRWVRSSFLLFVYEDAMVGVVNSLTIPVRLDRPEGVLSLLLLL